MRQININLKVEAFAKPKTMGKIGKKEFLKLNYREQQNYLKAYPKSSYRFLLDDGLGGKPGEVHIRKKPKFGKPKAQHTIIDNAKPKKETTRQLAIVKDIRDTERDQHKNTNRNFINKESIGAIQKLTQKDTRQAGEAIKSKAPVIVDAVFDQWEDKPNLFSDGLKATRKLFEGSKVTPSERLDSKQIIASVAKYALITAGVTFAAMGAAPMALLTAHMLHQSWDTLSDADGSRDRSQKRKDDEARKQQEAEELEREAMTPEDFYEEEKDRLDGLFHEGRIGRRAYKQALLRAKSKFEEASKENTVEANTSYDAEEDDDAKLVKQLVYTIGDFLSNLDLEEMQTLAKGAFEGVASAEPVLTAIKHVAERHGCNTMSMEQQGSLIRGSCKSNHLQETLTALTSFLKRSGYDKITTDIENGEYTRQFVKNATNTIVIYHSHSHDKLTVIHIATPKDKNSIKQLLRS